MQTLEEMEPRTPDGSDDRTALAAELFALLGNEGAASWVRSCEDCGRAWATAERPAQLVVLAAAVGASPPRILAAIDDLLGAGADPFEADVVADARLAVASIGTGRSRGTQELWATTNLHRALEFVDRDGSRGRAFLDTVRARLGLVIEEVAHVPT